MLTCPLLVLATLLFASVGTNAFVISAVGQQSSAATQLSATRRELLAGSFSLVGAAIIVSANADPAQASYSAYAAREKDWDERLKKGEVKVSSPRELRKQLREIVPANDDSRSKVFCPNGTPSNVSPLMENKCSDVLMALPSVYGRTQDSVGNSIPGGFTGGELTSLTAATGGFPRY
jgi:hypothetical protein